MMNTQTIVPFVNPLSNVPSDPGLFTNTGHEERPTMASIIGQMDLPGNPTPKECATMEAMLRSGTPF